MNMDPWVDGSRAMISWRNELEVRGKLDEHAKRTDCRQAQSPDIMFPYCRFSLLNS